jgi:hypothetical protein
VLLRFLALEDEQVNSEGILIVHHPVLGWVEVGDIRADANSEPPEGVRDLQPED